MAPIEREDLLVSTFVQLTNTLVDDFDIIDLLTFLADGCVELNLAAAAGILLVDNDDKLRVMAASSDRARLLELFQLQNDEGPCLDAFSGREAVTEVDLRQAKGRWPIFAPEAVDAGFRSVHAIPLRLRTTVIGALNLFGDRVGAMPEADLTVARALADVVSIAIIQNQTIRESEVRAGQLQRALDSRVAIEQAKGMLAERSQIDMDSAFRHLRSFARNTRRHLTAVAVDVVSGAVALDEVRSGSSVSPSSLEQKPGRQGP
jgi:transcriptional regulator with GAF, ATPase, and Fis domain